MNTSLVGKNALVGGGSAGIGRAVAAELAQLGANVTLLARSEDRLMAAKEILDTSQGQMHDILVADYSDIEKLKVGVDALLEKRSFQILVNNTGGPPGGPISEASDKEFISAFHNHLLCNHLLLQALLPGMKKAGYGRVINVISTSVKEPIVGLGVSNTTRWAVASWAKTLSVELGEFGITVNNVLPGFTNTSRLDEIIENRVKKSAASRSVIENSMKSQVPLRRFAEPEEVAAAVAFLASPAAGYISGINLPVDGGRTKSL
ncbi:MAG: SDR family oxidoreductase [Lewinellaceae bacterium]|nr:SDR family oxidoreductase [Saprospiraceae bacterium]MCB9345108.1 SDR family oxidoreductase [Lewinellaceae bacterium]